MVKTQSGWRKAANKWLTGNYVERPKGKAALPRGSSSSMNQRLREHLTREGLGCGAPNDKDRPTATNIKTLIGNFGKRYRAARIAHEAQKRRVTRTNMGGSGSGSGIPLGGALQTSAANVQAPAIKDNAFNNI